MPPADVFLSFQGRLGRERWLAAVAVLVTLLAAGHVLTERAAGEGVVTAATARSLRLFLGAFVLAPWLAIDWKRFHDRGRTGLLALICPGLAVVSRIVDQPSIAVALSWTQLCVALWLVYALAFAKGDAHENRFGPPPPPWPSRKVAS